MGAQIGHGRTEVLDHVIEGAAEQIEVGRLTEYGEEACDVPAVGNGVFTPDADEQTQRRVASEFFDWCFGDLPNGSEPVDEGIE